MQKKKNNISESLVVIVLAVFIILVVTATAMLFLTSSSVKKSNKAKQEATQTSKSEDETNPEEESTEVMLNGFSVGTIAVLPTPIPEVEASNPEEVAGETSDYVIMDSNARYITVEELVTLTQVDLSRARNEIYARHGRIFESVELKAYFESKAWYVPLYTSETFPDGLLNDYETENAKIIGQYEEEKGYK